MATARVIPFGKGWEDIERTKPTKRKIQEFIPIADIEFVKGWPRFVSVAFVAKELGLHPRTVRLWIENKEFKAMNVGGTQRPTYRIFRDDIAAFLAKRAG